MGVYLSRSDDVELYRDAYDEAQRIIRVSDEVRISLEKVTKEPEKKEKPSGSSERKITTSKLAKKLGLKTRDLTEQLITSGHLEIKDGKNYITSKGKQDGGEFRMSSKFGPYFLWPEDLSP